MKKKKIFMVILMATISTMLFAGGAAEFFSGMAQGTGLGAALGFIFGGVPGAIVGGMLGGTAGMVVGGIEGGTVAQAEVEGDKQNALDTYNQALGHYNELDAMQSSTQLNILQGQSNLNSFDEALTRLPAAMDLQRKQMEVESQAQYTQLMNNWQGQELVNAARGQSGGSVALVAQQQKAQVETLAGTDLKLDLVGGMYGQMMNEFNLDYASQLRELNINRQNQQTALDIQQENLKKIQEELKKAQTTVDESKLKAEGLGVTI